MPAIGLPPRTAAPRAHERTWSVTRQPSWPTAAARILGNYWHDVTRPELPGPGSCLPEPRCLGSG